MMFLYNLVEKYTIKIPLRRAISHCYIAYSEFQFNNLGKFMKPIITNDLRSSINKVHIPKLPTDSNSIVGKTTLSCAEEDVQKICYTLHANGLNSLADAFARLTVVDEKSTCLLSDEDACTLAKAFIKKLRKSDQGTDFLAAHALAFVINEKCKDKEAQFVLNLKNCALDSEDV